MRILKLISFGFVCFFFVNPLYASTKIYLTFSSTTFDAGAQKYFDKYLSFVHSIQVSVNGKKVREIDIGETIIYETEAQDFYIQIERKIPFLSPMPLTDRVVVDTDMNVVNINCEPLVTPTAEGYLFGCDVE